MVKSILIVDDEVAVTLALEMFFRSRGYHVVKAFHGEQAIAEIQNEQPEVAVLDLHMPGTNGVEVLEKVREKFPHVKVLVVTGYSDKYKNDLERLKPDAIQLKPVSLDQLVNTVETLMSSSSERSRGTADAAQ